jgi:predicted RNase H-like nuclease (RuvC/YqgF family)
MKVEIKTNNIDECYDLIDIDSDQSHDGDNAKELVAKVYEYPFYTIKQETIVKIINNKNKLQQENSKLVKENKELRETEKRYCIRKRIHVDKINNIKQQNSQLKEENEALHQDYDLIFKEYQKLKEEIENEKEISAEACSSFGEMYKLKEENHKLKEAIRGLEIYDKEKFQGIWRSTAADYYEEQIKTLKAMVRE